jgi:hypothetical protein
MDPHHIIKLQEFNRPSPCNISAIEDVIRIKFVQNPVYLQSKPYILASWQNVLMRLDLSDVTQRSMWQIPHTTHILFLSWDCQVAPSSDANNPENAETEGASVTGIKGG